MAPRKKVVAAPVAAVSAPAVAPVVAAATASAAPAKPSGSLTRMIGPAIPLAVALLGGALAGPATPAKTTAPVAVVQTTGGNTLAGVSCGLGTEASPTCQAPYPMLEKGHPVDWWFVFKFNTAKFPKCGGGVDGRACPFGGTPGAYTSFGQQYVYASAESATLETGVPQCLGDGTDDPVGGNVR
jgi:hypothetical protein